jgi:RNA polymerase sigma-70 factor (ECF subfamily)
MNTVTDTTVTDEKLINEYKKGDNNCLGKLYERYYKKVYYKCLSFTRNPEDANDIAQDILMKAFANITSFRGKSKFATWLFAITKNHCIAHSREKNHLHFENIIYNENVAEETIDLNERKLYEQRELILDHMLKYIRETERKMLLLKYQQNYSIKDLQKEFNLSASAIKMRLQRARQKVQKLYEQNEISPAVVY